MHLYNTSIVSTYTCTPTLTCTLSLTKCTNTLKHPTVATTGLNLAAKMPPSVHRLYKRLQLRKATGTDRRPQSCYSPTPRSVLAVQTQLPSLCSVVVKIVLLVLNSFSSENVRTDAQGPKGGADSSQEGMTGRAVVQLDVLGLC